MGDKEPRKLHALDRRLRYEEKQACRARGDDERELHIVRYVALDRRYTNLVGRHYVPREVAR